MARRSSHSRRVIAKACRSSVMPELLEGRTLFSIPEPNDTFAQAYAPATNIEQFYLSENYSDSGQVTAGSDTWDVYKFYNLYGNSHLYASLLGQSSDGDLFVYDTNGVQLASSTAGGNASETINVDIAGHQYFYVAVKAFSGTDNYGLYLYNDYAGSSMGTARDNGVSLGQTDNLYQGYNSSISKRDYLDYRDNVDYVKFQMEASGTVDLRMKDFDYNGNLVANMQLLDSQGNVLADAGTGTVGNGLNIQGKSLSAGTYYVRFTQVSGSDPYTYRIVSDYAGDTVAKSRDLGDITNTSRELTDMVSSFGGNTYYDPTDLYQFSVSEVAPLNMKLIIDTSRFPSPTFGANLALAQDANFDGVIGSNEIITSVNNTSAVKSIDTALVPGTYYAVVTQSGAYTTYQLDLDSDFDSVAGDPKAYSNLSQANNVGTLIGQSYYNGGFGISPGDSNDFYKFTLATSGRFDANAFIDSTNSRNPYLPYLTVCRDLNGNGHYDNGEQLAAGEQGSTILNLSAGTYYLMVSGGGGQTAYNLRMSADYAGQSIGGARAFAAIPSSGAPTQTFTDYIQPNYGGTFNDFNDFYSFSLPNTQSVTLKTTGPAGLDLALSLIQDKNNNGIVDDGEVLANGDNPNSPNEQFTKQLAAGKYFVRVMGETNVGNYTLSASFAAANTGDPDNTFSKIEGRSANIKTPGSSVDFTLDSLKDVDLVRFSVSAGQRVSFDMDSRNGSNLDTVLRLFKADGTQLAINNNGREPGENASKFSYLEYVFPTAGNYYVGASLAGNDHYDPKTGANIVNGTGPTGTYRLYLNNLGTTSPTVLRVDAGGNSFVTANGDFFAADTGFTGGTKSTASFAVANTTDDYLFATNRIGSSFSFSKAVKNGTYQLTLNFADPTVTSAGQRKFNVFAEGTKILSNFDIVATAGAGKSAVGKTFNVTVNDGKIDLSFAGVLGNAVVSGISMVAL